MLRVIDSHPDGLLLAILYYTGLRRGEALGLRWSDIDFPARILRVKRDIDFVTGKVGTVKTDTSVRTVPAPDELMVLLQKNRQIGNGYIIRAPRTGEFWSQATFVRRWRPFASGAAQRRARHRKQRRRFDPNPALFPAQLCIDPLPLRCGCTYRAALLGHADPTTTMRIYTHLAEETVLKDAEKVRKAFR